MRVKYLCIVVVMLLVGILTSPVYAKIEPENVVGMWLLDDLTNNIAIDSSGNGFNGTANTAIQLIEGKFGKAVNLTGGNSIVVPDNAKLNFGTKSFSVVTWLNFSTAQDWNRLVRERTPSPWTSGNYGWEIQTEGIQIHFSLDDKAGAHQRTTYANVGNGKWHHGAMIVSRDGKEKLLITYLDGENEQKVNISNIGSVTGELPITIGGGFAGSLDEVAIFNTVLSVEDVQTIMNSGLAKAIAPIAVSPASKAAITWAKIKAQ